MNSKAKSLYTMAILGAIASSYAQTSERECLESEEQGNESKSSKNSEPPIPKGMKYYCFRWDGTFKQYERDGAMLKEEKFFDCYALNDKNAIKKFDKFILNQK